MRARAHCGLALPTNGGKGQSQLGRAIETIFSKWEIPGNFGECEPHNGFITTSADTLGRPTCQRAARNASNIPRTKRPQYHGGAARRVPPARSAQIHICENASENKEKFFGIQRFLSYGALRICFI